MHDEIQILCRIDVKLEEALGETINLQAAHTLDVQIHRIRAEIKERITNCQDYDKCRRQFNIGGH